MRPTLAPGFVLNVYKEVSWTSHDAVGRVRVDHVWEKRCGVSPRARR